MATPLEIQEQQEAVGRRLREAFDRLGMHKKDVAEIGGVSVKTLDRYFAGTTSQDFGVLRRLAALFEVPVTYFAGDEPTPAPKREAAAPSDKTGRARELSVPIFDIRVSAGPGRELLGEEPVGRMSFPVDMLRSLGTPEAMALLQLDGDSMWPELRDRQLVMIDTAQREPREGILVVRLDQQLLCKRLRLVGEGTAELVSTNTAYPPIAVQLTGDRFDVIGRAVWSGGRLS